MLSVSAQSSAAPPNLITKGLSLRSDMLNPYTNAVNSSKP
ncbi:Uncharacterised protein [Vibrio cholerae]|nr:Uncharacterised protein [Vibrio cholerae]